MWLDQITVNPKLYTLSREQQTASTPVILELLDRLAERNPIFAKDSIAPTIAAQMYS